jgi:Mg2+ and Co2+ transporter CorA
VRRYPLVPEILSQHEEIEETLEVGLHIFSELETALLDTTNRIRSAERNVRGQMHLLSYCASVVILRCLCLQYSLRLDISRNKALVANTIVSIFGAAVGFGAYITGVFGMNLNQVFYLQPVKGGFVTITMLTLVAIAVLFTAVYVYFARQGVFPSSFS